MKATGKKRDTGSWRKLTEGNKKVLTVSKISHNPITNQTHNWFVFQTGFLITDNTPYTHALNFLFGP